jgi:hypothetical protein
MALRVASKFQVTTKESRWVNARNDFKQRPGRVDYTVRALRTRHCPM